MLSKNKIKYIRSLHFKKNRIAYKQFVVEGKKLCSELVGLGIKPELLAITKTYAEHESAFKNVDNLVTCTSTEMEQMTSLKTAPGILALLKIPEYSFPNKLDQHSIYLDGIRDPGNLGTIIRTADWFGYKRVFCSRDCVDAYNQKSVQSSMGSIFRVKVFYAEINQLLKIEPLKCFGLDMKGKPLETVHIPSDKKSVIILGSESHGIGMDVKPKINETISISNYGSAESLNAAVALGIALFQFSK